MAVTVTIECDGQCGADPLVIKPRRQFRSFTGRSYGIGVYETDCYIEQGEAAGWWVFDPFTQVTYCPACKADILAGAVENA